MSGDQTATDPRVAPDPRWKRLLPIAEWLPRYRTRYLAGDVLAGLVVAALAIPQSLGYAAIAGVPVVVGLYAIPLALIAYAMLGSSPHLVVGPVSTVSVLSGTLVADLARGDGSTAIALTAALAIGAGVGLIIGGVAKLGWAAEFMSRPIVTGFVFGLVLLIIVGELPNLLGLPAESGDVFVRAWALATNLGAITPLTAAIGVLSLVILFVGARLVPKIPWGLLVLLVAIVVSSAFDFADRGVATVGEVPQGLPGLALPMVSVSELPAVFTGGIALAMVGLAEGLSAARLFAAKEGYSIKTNQELIATGAANVAAGLSGGMGVAGSLSKTAAMVRSGARSQMAGLVAAVLVLVVIAAFAGSLAPLPKAALAAIVIQAVWGLMDVRAIRRYQKIRRNDFNSSLAAMFGVLVFGPLYGLLIAVGLAVLGLVYRSSRIDMEIMGRVPEEKAAWGGIRNHPERMTYDGVIVMRLDAPLFWANATEIQDGIIAAVDADPDVRALVLDLEATSQLDTTSIDALELLWSQLEEREVDLYLVRVFFQARRVLRRAGLLDKLGPDHMWHSIAAGVRAARKAQNLTGKPHAQDVDDSNDDDDTPGRERIAVDDANGYNNGEEINADGEAVPRGGYQDPFNAERRTWWGRLRR